MSTDRMKDVCFISEYERTFCVREAQRMKEIAQKALSYSSWVISRQQLHGYTCREFIKRQDWADPQDCALYILYLDIRIVTLKKQSQFIICKAQCKLKIRSPKILGFSRKGQQSINTSTGPFWEQGPTWPRGSHAHESGLAPWSTV